MYICLMETTCGIFLIDNRDQCLIVHPTGHQKHSWSLPKGRLELGEDYLETAIRELFEETGINLPEYASYITMIRRLPSVKYTTRPKTLVPFVIWLSISMQNVHLYCDIQGDDRFPENDDFKWVGLRQLFRFIHPTQKSVIQHVQSHYYKHLN